MRDSEGLWPTVSMFIVFSEPLLKIKTFVISSESLTVPTFVVGAQQRLRCHEPQILLRQEEGKKIAARNRREQVA